MIHKTSDVEENKWGTVTDVLGSKVIKRLTERILQEKIMYS